MLGALRVYLGDAPLCVSTPSGHCLLAALAACLRPLCKQIKWANGRMDVLFVVLSPVRRQPWQQLRELATANVFVKSRAAGELPLKTAKTETPRRTQRTQLSSNSRREDEEKKWPKVLQIS